MDMSEWSEDGPDWYEPELPDVPAESPESPPVAEETAAEVSSSSESPEPAESPGDDTEPPAEVPEVEEPADGPVDVPPLPEDESGGGDPPVPIDAGEGEGGPGESVEFPDEPVVESSETEDESFVRTAQEWMDSHSEYQPTKAEEMQVASGAKENLTELSDRDRLEADARLYS